MLIDRRRSLGLVLGAGAAVSVCPLALAADQPPLIRRAIPSSGERVPAIGLGTAATFSSKARAEDLAALRDVMRTMVDRGATVIDTAPVYGGSERVAGALARELGIADRIFWATKVNAAINGVADREAVIAQLERSFRHIGVPRLDLVQVHNLADVPVQLAVLKQLQKEGRVRYVGVTTTSKSQYAQLETLMRSEPLDFIGIDYAADNRSADRVILPLAAARGIAVMAYVPFGKTRLFRRVARLALPDWAADFDAATWAQFFIKFVLGHRAVTVVTPATSQAAHMIDNVGGGIGRLPDDATRERMAKFVDALPQA
ncbi:MAG TPA: aldo/keto reductase [Steroidobacteraceae bacterium]|nr:aldo/keto reductase [Steroidobacteraceae bacterium]